MIELRIAEPTDISDLAELVTLFSSTRTSPEQIKNRLVSMKETEQVIVAVEKSKVVGFGSLRLVPNFSDDHLYAEVTDLFVHPDFRRMKIAHQIMFHIDAICKEKGILQIILITGFDNDGAQAFYHTIGFKDWALAMKKEY